MFKVWGPRVRVEGSRFRLLGLELVISGLGYRISERLSSPGRSSRLLSATHLIPRFGFEVWDFEVSGFYYFLSRISGFGFCITGFWFLCFVFQGLMFRLSCCNSCFGCTHFFGFRDSGFGYNCFSGFGFRVLGTTVFLGF